MSAAPIHRSARDGIAIIAIENPPVNALAHPVRAALLEAIVACDADPATRAIVIHGIGRHFVAGADIREFDAEPLAPLLNDVLLRVEASAKPVVAALHGSVLGGGLELALASHYRCATPDASIGLPEIKLGLLPGSGGTQRLPRLIGPMEATEMMLSGAPVTALRARDLRIVDRIIDGEALDGALSYARDLLKEGAGPRRLRDFPVDGNGLAPGFFVERRAAAERSNPGLLAPGYIVDCVAAALSRPFDEALAFSRRCFEECRKSVASRALRHLFFAERPGEPATGAVPHRVAQVAVIGAGTMGGGIAISLATAGLNVTLIDTQPSVLDGARARIASTIDAAVAKGRLAAEAGRAAIGRVGTADALSAAASADLVIEAVFESMSVKREVFATLDRVCRSDAVLASNTSTLDIDEIAGATTRPSAVLGMHFFSPANVMRLVEVVNGAATSPDVLATALATTRRIGKLGIVVGNGFGFVGNKMLYAYGGQNQLLLLEGASPASIDAALKAFGMAMGPNEVGDLAGLDVGYRIRRERKDRPSDPRFYRVADLLVEAGRLGQKAGRGAYRYENGSRSPVPDPEVAALIESESARLGIERRAVGAEEIVERCTLALINEGARLLGAGIARSAADIDAIWCNGYGFPRLRGGPMYYADTLGLREVVAGIRRYGDMLGRSDWTVAPVLAELAASGGSFGSCDRDQAAVAHPGAHS